MSTAILAIDQGTTSTRCILFDRANRLLASAQAEHQQHYPRPGWVEHDAVEIWETTQALIPQVLAAAHLEASDIAGIGITNQRETVVVWDRRTGQPIHPAIVWQDTRTDELCKRLALGGGQDRLRAKTGLPIATYFSGPKLQWLLDHVPGARERARRGELLFGTIDTWLIWNLTGGVHVTDPSNASRTLLMNLMTLEWDEELLSLMNIPRDILPSIRSSSEIYGLATGPLAGVPVAGDLGDQQAAEVETLATTVTDNGGIYIVPAFSGLFAPYWRSDARGAIVGLTRYVNKGHFARAALEATAYQTKEILDAMRLDSGQALSRLKVDGGMVANDTLMQFQSDLLGVPVIRPETIETTALGAAYAAGLAVGFWKDTDELKRLWQANHAWQPAMPASQRETLFAGWKKAVTKSLDWLE